ncbi:phosphatase PAP2 family protein [Paraconexibacter antarcticus]|uniref:Phosphatase PAP2 family protein n=1 Tax=Paraconexibacter antarcticus TaxID=2949664 RepID=A0ABY5DM51_9ACTN|nr:phosphatase PAP2 family protein [Paraconexibacter antarcticus]UTI63003.1 phosphatase PAP2 family protein [Paraconexibacter antarcticus]
MDFTIAHALDHFALRHDGFEDVLRAYVVASEYLFMALVAALLLAAVVRGEYLTRAVGVLAGVSAGLALLVGKVISTAVDRPRPFVSHSSIHDFLAHAADPGMPSDHATAAFAIGTAILVAHRRAGAAVLVAATVLALGRVFLGVHYLSDVAVGALLGTASALAVAAVARRLPDVRIPLLARRAA